MGERLPNLGRMLAERGPFRSDAMDPTDARRAWNAYRRASGMRTDAPFTLPGASNQKLAKSSTETRGLTLAPAAASGLVDVCPNATASCRGACVLMTAGKGTLRSVREARALRTRFLAENPTAAVVLMHAELMHAAANAGDLLVRLNVASDLPWEDIAPDLFTIRGARFYDYTKVPARVREPHASYRLVFSYSEAPHATRVAEEYMTRGGTAAVVFATRRGDALPEDWHGFPVVDGDASDDRTADPRGVVVGLRAKGAGRSLPVGGFIQPGRTLLPVSVV